jgi:hypothetical protein
VITRQPIYPGALIRVRPIGILKMIDGGDVDDKIVAVPISKLDPTYDEIKTIDDLPAIERARIVQFFAVYKKLPDGRKVVKMKGYDGVNACGGHAQDRARQVQDDRSFDLGAVTTAIEFNVGSFEAHCLDESLFLPGNTPPPTRS